MLSKVRRKSVVRGRTGLHELMSMMNRSKNPKEGRQACPRREGEMA